MEPLHLTFVALAAVLLGLAKSGVPGLGMLVVLLLALAFPGDTKLSVGVLLPMLLVGDVAALSYYHHHAKWDRLIPLIPSVVVGMVGARFVLVGVEEAVFRPLLGGLILAMLAVELLRARMGWQHLPHHLGFRLLTGVTAGFATTLANAGGPIMAIYLLSHELPKKQFVGTAAWFFFLVNLSKVPVYAQLGMIRPHLLRLDAMMIPLIVLGAFLGIRLLPHISQTLFNRLVIIVSALAALRLLF